MPEREKESYSIQSVDHALDLLEALCEETDEFRISNLSKKLGLNKTSVFRLLATFENRGYVEKESNSGRYRLGLSAYEIGQKFLSRMELLRKARPVMERLARTTNEAVYLTVRRGDELLLLDLSDTTQQVKIISLVGKRYPLHQTAAGKIFLAHPPQRPTDPSAPAHAYLAPEEIQQILRQGFSYDRDSLGRDIVSIAAPLFNANAGIAGVLVVLGPEFRLPPDKIENAIQPFLLDAADTISSKLGHVNHYLGKDSS